MKIENILFTRAAILLAFLSLLLPSCSNQREGDPKVLVFTKTVGFKHSSIPNGIAAIQKLGEENGFVVDTTENSSLFNEDNLSQYSAVIFLNTTMDVLDHLQEISFERYIQSGGGYVGVHAAADTEYGWNWYGKLAGAYFLSHPATQEANFQIEDFGFSATNFFVDTVWTRTDELYNFKNINEDISVIMSVDESSYEGGENGATHPMAWYHEYDGGRSFYTALGHTEESYEEEFFLKHLLGGIQYAIGDNNNLDYSKARSQFPPDYRRFTKIPLAVGEFYEPTEMAILPNKDVLIAERRGGIKHYNAETEELTDIATLDVYHTSGVQGVNAEEGLMGLQKDPNYSENNWIYVYYSPSGQLQVNRLSRFKFADGKWDMSSEQVILDVASDRYICCHTGGSIAFDANGLLYLSTGDNSTPFDEPGAQFANNGYAPLNDLPGKKQYDARRSSGNTNDLRGKILRIKVNEDGSYDIPEGNLFPKGTAKTRPEIYTMGHRNPYRISVDPKNGYVYWGDVGPDAGEDKWGERGPRGYDEMNQAKKAGNFGWPLFIADNKAYYDYDYSNGKTGAQFDPEKPINDSKNNTGLTELPPAQGAYIYYDYGESMIHQQTTSGGRNAMAGPAHYKDLYNGPNALPDYYDGKVIIYDWMRHWMKAVNLFDNGDFNKIEPFAQDIELANLIDMEMAEDGTIYLLEYGSGWFSKNEDSGLSYIKYNGDNLPPTIEHIDIDRSTGAHPMTVNISVEASDLENDELSYIYDFGDGEIKESNNPQISYTYKEAGDYNINVEVYDTKKMKAAGMPIPVVSGNTTPTVEIDLSGGNSSFFIPGVPINYSVSVSDQEDGSNIDESNIFVSVDLVEGYDEVSASTGHQVVSEIAQGEALTNGLDCKACHKAVGKSIGPSYTDIAKKYNNTENTTAYLQGTIINGSTGVWGETNMPAHPDLDKSDARLIALYIQSLSGEQAESMPPNGTFTPPSGNNDGKTLLMTASYTDQGHEGIKALTGSNTVSLKSNTISMGKAQDIVEFNEVEFGDMELLILPRNGGSFAFNEIDLTGVKTVNVIAGWQSAPNKGITLQLRKNALDGDIIGTGRMGVPKKGSENGMISIQLNQSINEKLDKLYFVYDPSDEDRFGLMTFAALVQATFSAD